MRVFHKCNAECTLCPPKNSTAIPPCLTFMCRLGCWELQQRCPAWLDRPCAVHWCLGWLISIRPRGRATALHAAAYADRLAVVKRLVQRGTSVVAKDNDGYLPLHMAAGLSTFVRESGDAVPHGTLHCASKGGRVGRSEEGPVGGNGLNEWTKHSAPFSCPAAVCTAQRVPVPRSTTQLRAWHVPR